MNLSPGERISLIRRPNLSPILTTSPCAIAWSPTSTVMGLSQGFSNWIMTPGTNLKTCSTGIFLRASVTVTLTSTRSRLWQNGASICRDMKHSTFRATIQSHQSYRHTIVNDLILASLTTDNAGIRNIACEGRGFRPARHFESRHT